ncbi:MAG TPA: hypothetical protein VGR35_13940 [Tepidisphaeraceae bacterium]|nr:hypothetical protein [Tepidisphaeraceae bacterium]
MSEGFKGMPIGLKGLPCPGRDAVGGSAGGAEKRAGGGAGIGWGLRRAGAIVR